MEKQHLQHRSKILFYSMVVLMGILVVLSYIVLLPLVNTHQDINALWFGIHGRMRQCYYVSIVLSAIAFVSSTTWLYFHSKHINQMWIPYFVFLVGAVSWSVALWLWGNYKSTTHQSLNIVLQICVVLALVITSIGACGMLYQSIRKVFSTWVIIMYVYVCFHVVVLDNIGWTLHFLTNS